MPVLDRTAVEISVAGDVPAAERAYALEKLDAVAASTTARVLSARVRLVMERDPARERRAGVQGALDLDGRVVRAHVAAPTLHEAIDRFEDRLREQVERVETRTRSLRLRHRDAGPGRWHHGDHAAHRPPWFDRPPTDRRILTRKAFVLDVETPDEAVFDMECLDHDFFLFTNAQSGEENVVVRGEDGTYELVQPTPTPEALARCAAPIRLSPVVPATLPLEQAIERLDVTEEPFVFFVDATSGRGNVVYRRYDGHYGRLLPAA